MALANLSNLLTFYVSFILLCTRTKTHSDYHSDMDSWHRWATLFGALQSPIYRDLIALFTWRPFDFRHLVSIRSESNNHSNQPMFSVSVTMLSRFTLILFESTEEALYSTTVNLETMIFVEDPRPPTSTRYSAELIGLEDVCLENYHKTDTNKG